MIVAEGPNGERLEFPDDATDDAIKKGIQYALKSATSADVNKPQIIPPPSGTGALVAPVDPMIAQRAQSQANRDLMLRQALIGAGATAGGVVGVPLGPAGMLGGSALGAAAGEAAYGGIKGRPPMETARKALKEAQTDLIFTGAASSLRPLLQTLGAMRRGALGVGEKELGEVIEGQKFGVDLSPTEVSRFHTIKESIKVIGRFPFLGTPAKGAAAKRAQQVFEGKERILATLGPVKNMADVGVDFNVAAKNAFKGFKEEASQLYDTAKSIADDAGEIIPTANLKKTAKIIADNFDAARPGRSPQKGPIVEFADSLKNMPDNLTGSQFDALMDDLDVALAKAKNDGFGVKNGMTIKDAAEVDLRSSPHEAFKAAIEQADDFFARGMTTFETPTAQKFNRVEKNAFRVGLSKPGTLNEDELFRAAFNTKSAKAMNDLHNLVGDKAFNQAVRAHIDKAFTAAEKQVENVATFDPNVFIKTLGLGDSKSAEYKALKAALKKTGVEPSDFIRFAKVADRALSTEIPNVSTFIARRATMGGARSAVKALLPGLAAGSAATGHVGPATAILVTLGARQGVKMLSNPKTLKLATRAMDEELTIAMRRAAAARFVRLYLENPEIEDQGAE